MFALALMRGALSAVSTVFGGLGVFFLYRSCFQPRLSAYAVILLVAATAMVLAAPRQEAPARKRQHHRKSDSE